MKCSSENRKFHSATRLILILTRHLQFRPPYQVILLRYCPNRIKIRMEANITKLCGRTIEVITNSVQNNSPLLVVLFSEFRVNDLLSSIVPFTHFHIDFLLAGNNFSEFSYIYYTIFGNRKVPNALKNNPGL
jgi:hypothetical protein